jgi:hypothetical protein
MQGKIMFHRPERDMLVGPSSPLDNIVILDALWFNKEVMSAVVTGRHRFVKEGVVSKQDLINFVWRGVAPQVVNQFLFLLEKYEILFPLDTPDSFLVPSKLPEGGPDPVVWGATCDTDEPVEARWVFTLYFVPEGLFSRIIARLHQLQIRQKAWRTCTLLNNDNHRALIRLDPPQDDTKAMIRIVVREEQPCNLLAVLIDLVQQLVTCWYRGLRLESMVCFNFP